MKKLLNCSLLSLALTLTANAADKDKHEPAAKGGPTGGRLITEVEPHVEFLVTKDRKVEIRFVDDDNKVVAPGGQIISVVMGDRSAPTTLTFTRDGDKLVSDTAIPEGNDLPTVLRITPEAGQKALMKRFNLNLDDCPTSDHKEYACICEHDDEKK